MKNFILLSIIALTFTACGGGSDNRAPEGAVGLWADAVPLDAASNLNADSRQFGECAVFEVQNRPGTYNFGASEVISNGNIYELTATSAGTFRAEEASARVNKDGKVRIPKEVRELSVFDFEVYLLPRTEDTMIMRTEVEIPFPNELSVEEVLLQRITEQDLGDINLRLDRYCR